jgi:2-methylcitrate dehydratase PrpD
LDFDDSELAGSAHPSAARIALGELQDSTCDAPLEANVAGFEIITRLGQALGYAR